MKFTNVKTLENFITTSHYVLLGENFFFKKIIKTRNK